MSEKIEEWNLENAGIDESLFTTRLREKGLNDSQIEAVLDTINCTCTACWDSPSACSCWRDD